jgi:hypothetical protein
MVWHSNHRVWGYGVMGCYDIVDSGSECRDNDMSVCCFVRNWEPSIYASRVFKLTSFICMDICFLLVIEIMISKTIARGDSIWAVVIKIHDDFLQISRKQTFRDMKWQWQLQQGHVLHNRSKKSVVEELFHTLGNRRPPSMKADKKFQHLYGYRLLHQKSGYPNFLSLLDHTNGIFRSTLGNKTKTSYLLI